MKLYVAMQYVKIFITKKNVHEMNKVKSGVLKWPVLKKGNARDLCAEWSRRWRGEGVGSARHTHSLARTHALNMARQDKII